MADLRFYFFGSPRLERDGAAISFMRRKSVALLAYLCLTPQTHSRDTLAALLWPDYNQNKSRTSLRQVLTDIRQSLGKDYLELEHEDVAISPNWTEQVDVLEFRACIGMTATHGHASKEVCDRCVEPLSQAVRLYRADFLAGFTVPDCGDFDDWLTFQTEQLRMEFVGALDRLIRYYVQQHSFDEAFSYARHWLSLDPLDERPYRYLMRLYALAGQTAVAIEQFNACKQVVEAAGLALESETLQLHQQIREMHSAGVEKAVRTSVAAPVIAPRTNLPSLPNAFIGRATALRHVCDYLTMPECRLLTLVGAPGVGKTRLGIRAAEQVLPLFPDGVFFVGLAAISDPALVPYAIADAVGIRQRGETPIADVLDDFLTAKRCLLVLDNFEHVLAAAPGVGDLLACAPGVKVLTTSREALELYGEHEYVVSPLALPNLEQQADIDALSQNEAVRLFVQRAQAAASEFRLTHDNAYAVAEICTRLDGLPLAIELAAARVKVYAPDDLLTLLDQRLNVLTSTIRNLPARHRTLHNAIEWSYNLLDDSEQTLFRRLGLFAGGWTLDSAEAVYSVGLVELAKTLEVLCSKNLVQPMIGLYGEQRFTMLETLREFALRKLGECGETEDARHAQAAFFLKLIEQADMELRTTDQPRWLHYLEADQENLRSTMKWLLDKGDLATLQQLGVHLVAFWHEKGYLAEGRYWLERTLAAQGQLETRARTEEALFSLAWAQGDYTAAQQHASRHLELARALGDEKAIAEALYSLGGVALAVGDYVTAHAHYEESRKRYYRPKKPWSTSFALTGIGEVAYLQGDYASARQYYEEDLAHARETGSQQAISAALNGLAKVTDMLGDFQAAKLYAEESLLLAEQAGNQQGIAIAGNRLGRIARQMGDYARAQALHEKSLLIARSISSAPIIAYTLNKLGELALDQGDREAAIRLHTEALQINREMNDPYYVADSLCCLAAVKTKQGQLGIAHHYLTEALEIAWKIRATAILLHVFACFACWYAAKRQLEQALELLGFLTQYASLPYHISRLTQEVYASIDKRLSLDSREPNFERGRGLPAETVVARLLHNSD